MVQEKATYCRVCEVTCGLIATVEDGRVTKLHASSDDIEDEITVARAEDA